MEDTLLETRWSCCRGLKDRNNPASIQKVQAAQSEAASRPTLYRATATRAEFSKSKPSNPWPVRPCPSAAPTEAASHGETSSSIGPKETRRSISISRPRTGPPSRPVTIIGSLLSVSSRSPFSHQGSARTRQAAVTFRTPSRNLAHEVRGERESRVWKGIQAWAILHTILFLRVNMPLYATTRRSTTTCHARSP
jgi:hypothetical protein